MSNFYRRYIVGAVFAKIFLWFVLGLLSIELVNEALYALMPAAPENIEVSSLLARLGK